MYRAFIRGLPNPRRESHPGMEDSGLTPQVGSQEATTLVFVSQHLPAHGAVLNILSSAQCEERQELLPVCSWPRQSENPASTAIIGRAQTDFRDKAPQPPIWENRGSEDGSDLPKITQDSQRWHQNPNPFLLGQHILSLWSCSLSPLQKAEVLASSVFCLLPSGNPESKTTSMPSGVLQTLGSRRNPKPVFWGQGTKATPLRGGTQLEEGCQINAWKILRPTLLPLCSANEQGQAWSSWGCTSHLHTQRKERN